MAGWLTYKNAAGYCQVSAHTIRNWVKGGKLRVAVIGGIHRLRVADLDALFESNYEDSDFAKIEKEINQMVEGRQ